MSIKIGADPEVFLKDSNDEYISAIGIIGGTKEHPLKISNTISVQEDNVMAEFNITPATTANAFFTRIRAGVQVLNEISGKRGLNISVDASATFKKKQLLHKKTQEFGCDPDRSAWALESNRPITMKDFPSKYLRVAGGHIHVGFDTPDKNWKRERVIRMMDIFLGVPSVLLDTDNIRHTLYGKAGSYREKSYGVEYRTLSNFWLKGNLPLWVFRQVQLAYRFRNDITKTTRFGVSKEEIQRIINEKDKVVAKEFCKAFNIMMPDIERVYNKTFRSYT